MEHKTPTSIHKRKSSEELIRSSAAKLTRILKRRRASSASKAQEEDESATEAPKVDIAAVLAQINANRELIFSTALQLYQLVDQSAFQSIVGSIVDKLVEEYKPGNISLEMLRNEPIASSSQTDNSQNEYGPPAIIHSPHQDNKLASSPAPFDSASDREKIEMHTTSSQTAKSSVKGAVVSNKGEAQVDSDLSQIKNLLLSLSQRMDKIEAGSQPKESQEAKERVKSSTVRGTIPSPTTKKFYASNPPDLKEPPAARRTLSATSESSNQALSTTPAKRGRQRTRPTPGRPKKI